MKGPKPIERYTRPSTGGKHGALAKKHATKKSRSLGQTLKSKRFVDG